MKWEASLSPIKYLEGQVSKNISIACHNVGLFSA